MAEAHNALPEQGTQELTQQCPSCRQSDVKAVFEQLQERSVCEPLRLGDPIACHNTRSSCNLCQFICDVHGIEAPTGEYWATDGENYELWIDICGDPWYNKLDIISDAPTRTYGNLFYKPQKFRSNTSTCIFLEQDDGSEGIVPRVHPHDTPEKLDYSLLRRWLDRCQRQHSSRVCRDRSGTASFGQFYLVDVDSRQVIKAKPSVRYAALSYVWGSKGGQLDEDGQPRTALQLPDALPRTIADAVTVTQELGLQYLWVDLFCIDQGDPQHVQDQVDRMDKIYAAAHVTIIALDGADVEAGLAGVSRPLLRKQQHKYRTDAGTLVATHLPEPNRAFSSKPWNKRAWTMQEHLFSQRRLILDSSHVLLRCNTEYLHDCLPVLDLRASWSFTKSSSWFSFDCDSIELYSNDCFSAFSDILSVYTARSLGDQADVLRACQCMLTHLTRKTQDRWLYAHPEAHMIPSLLWKPHFRSYPRRRDQFPSWSWLGWKGSLEYSWWLHNDQLNQAYREISMSRRWRPDKSYLVHLSMCQFEARKEWHDRMKWFNRAAPTSIDRNGLVASWSVSGTELILDTVVTTWAVVRVRRHGDSLASQEHSQLSNVAVGDHWTFLDATGQRLEDLLGEHTVFNAADYFFRTSPEMSQDIGREVTIATLSFHDHVIDSRKSRQEAKNVVAGLVLLPRADGKMLRLASVAMPWHFFQHAPRERARVVIV